MFWLGLLSSFLIVAFGHPIWTSYWTSGLGLFSAAFGFALFWKVLLLVPRKRQRFFLSFIWFACVQAVQLSWLISTEYMGPLILLVYAFLCLAIGAQFGLLSLFLNSLDPSATPFRSKVFWLNALAISGGWVILEWSRTFFLTGFTWNPIGFALADSFYAIQLASVLGVYGLSFWMIFTNWVALKVFSGKMKGGSIATWLGLALFPYLFGMVHLNWIERSSEFSKEASVLSVALVQTALLPEQRDYTEAKPDAFVPPLDQWERVFGFLDWEKKVDLIVFPETAFPHGAHQNAYPFELVKEIWVRNFGLKSLDDFPPFTPTFGSQAFIKGAYRRKVNNAFLAQALSNHSQADIIIGLDDQDFESRKKYNAAFHFSPEGRFPQRYEKRTLVPISEYIPFQGWGTFSQFIAEQFGIFDSFHAGEAVKIFKASVPVGVSICVEETYGGLMRDLRRQGAQLFVNVTNDVWFPGSRLPRHHYEHARIRGVENGVGTLRSCNTGITGAIDCFGRPLESLPGSESEGGVLYLSLPIRNYKTLYTLWGEWAILGISLSSLICCFGIKKKKLP